ncbi:alpha/beta hydrolase family protein [Achromobacter xylosoxidans]|uniref:alpha/beta hydrolase family protein n=1 Tax=Alcaligenes xylosoxydans xylosoxydans TaxID=85698 RepID=UPI001EEDBFCA|nr:dienelactone hydrolase [Achromobacter xylosoxidans]
MFKPFLRACFALSLLATGAAHAAGFQRLNLPMDMNGPALQGGIWYPCAAPAQDVVIGRVTLAATPDCPMTDGSKPLIVMSHGSAGWYLGHHDTAAALADAGFVVAAINHVGDNAVDRSRQGYLSIFSTRPREIRRLLDYLTGAWPQRARLDGAIGFFGFSRGGYTGLVLAGAVPDFKQGLGLCADEPTLPMCRDIRDGKVPAQPYVKDARIQAMVIADPLNAFSADALKAVSMPVQLWASARGGDGVTPASVDAVRQGLAAPEFHQVAGAGHFAFLAPCSAAQAEAAPAVCRDAAGFDRAAWHRDFNAAVVAFFKTALPICAGQAGLK